MDRARVFTEKAVPGQEAVQATQLLARNKHRHTCHIAPLRQQYHPLQTLLLHIFYESHDGFKNL